MTTATTTTTGSSNVSSNNKDTTATTNVRRSQAQRRPYSPSRSRQTPPPKALTTSPGGVSNMSPRKPGLMQRAVTTGTPSREQRSYFLNHMTSIGRNVGGDSMCSDVEDDDDGAGRNGANLRGEPLVEDDSDNTAVRASRAGIRLPPRFPPRAARRPAGNRRSSSVGSSLPPTYYVSKPGSLMDQPATPSPQNDVLPPIPVDGARPPSLRPPPLTMEKYMPSPVQEQDKDGEEEEDEDEDTQGNPRRRSDAHKRPMTELVLRNTAPPLTTEASARSILTDDFQDSVSDEADEEDCNDDEKEATRAAKELSPALRGLGPTVTDDGSCDGSDLNCSDHRGAVASESLRRTAAAAAAAKLSHAIRLRRGSVQNILTGPEGRAIAPSGSAAAPEKSSPQKPLRSRGNRPMMNRSFSSPTVTSADSAKGFMRQPGRLRAVVKTVMQPSSSTDEDDAVTPSILDAPTRIRSRKEATAAMIVSRWAKTSLPSSSAPHGPSLSKQSVPPGEVESEPETAPYLGHTTASPPPPPPPPPSEEETNHTAATKGEYAGMESPLKGTTASSVSSAPGNVEDTGFGSSRGEAQASASLGGHSGSSKATPGRNGSIGRRSGRSRKPHSRHTHGRHHGHHYHHYHNHLQVLVDSVRKPDYAGYTGLRKLCNVPMLDGRLDPAWRNVREYLKSLPPDVCRDEAEACGEEDEDRGLDTDQEGPQPSDETALHLACRQRAPPDVIRLLLQASAAPAFWPATSRRWLPLHYECVHGGAHHEIIRLLLGVNPDAIYAVDAVGRTPLHLATEKDEAFVLAMRHTNATSGGRRHPWRRPPPTFASMRCLMTVDVVNVMCSDVPPDFDDESDDDGGGGGGTGMDVNEDSGRTLDEQYHQQQKEKLAACYRRHRKARYPVSIQYLADRASSILPDQTLERTAALQCLEVVLDAKLDAMKRPGQKETSRFLATIEASPEWFQDRAVQHPFMQAILNWKMSEHFPTAVLMLDFYVLVVLIISFRLAAHRSLEARGAVTLEGLLGRSNDTGMSMVESDFLCVVNTSDLTCALDDPAATANDDDLAAFCPTCVPLSVPVVLLYTGVAYLFLREVLQMISLACRGIFKAWLLDVWNYLDCLCISLVLSSTIRIHTGSDDDDVVRLYLVVTTGVLWMMMLSFLKLTGRNFAVFVSGVVHVTMTLMSFLVTLGIFLMAFAQMYFTDAQGSERCITKRAMAEGNLFNEMLASQHKYVEDNFCSFWGSNLKVYMMLVGGGMDEISFTVTPTSLWLSVIFAFLVVILLLNVLIAIVTDSYQEVKSHGEAVFWNHRLSFVFEVDQILELFQDYIFSWLRRRRREQRRRLLMTEDDESSSGEEEHAYFTENLRLLWEVCVSTFQDPSNFAVYKKRRDLQKRWRGPAWVLGKVVNCAIDPDRAVPSHWRRLLIATFMPLWMVMGVVTAGLLWPPQVRKYLLCPSISDKDEGSQPASKNHIESLQGELRDEVRKVEQAMEVRMDDLRVRLDQMMESMDEAHMTESLAR